MCSANSPTDILVNPNQTSEEQKQQVALVTASHIVQEWIEGLINFEMDEDEWIKESLVDYLKYVALSFVSKHIAISIFLNMSLYLPF